MSWQSCPFARYLPFSEHFRDHVPGLLARLTELLLPPEAPVTDYPFVASDVARYHRCTLPER
jgi:hypothetical protein